MEDKEFEARQERNRRLRNAEYEIEDEQRLTQARQEKEKKRMERARKNERLREEKERELRQARRKAAEAKKAEQKKQQSQLHLQYKLFFLTTREHQSSNLQYFQKHQSKQMKASTLKTIIFFRVLLILTYISEIPA